MLQFREDDKPGPTSQRTLPNEVFVALGDKLNTEEGFGSYHEVVDWLEQEHGIQAKQFVYGYYNDNICTATNLHARLLIEDDHLFAYEAREVEHLFGIADFDPEDSAFRELLVEECFDGEALSRSQFVEIVVNGGSIFR